MENPSPKVSKVFKLAFGVASSFLGYSLATLFIIYVGSLVFSYMVFFNPTVPSAETAGAIYTVIMLATIPQWISEGETFSWKRIYEDAKRK